MEHILDKEFERVPSNIRKSLVEMLNSHLRRCINQYQWSMKAVDSTDYRELKIEEFIVPVVEIVKLAQKLQENEEN